MNFGLLSVVLDSRNIYGFYSTWKRSRIFLRLILQRGVTLY